jgi:hypothetical protein
MGISVRSRRAQIRKKSMRRVDKDLTTLRKDPFAGWPNDAILWVLTAPKRYPVEYSTWKKIKYRCSNGSIDCHRGVTITPRWLDEDLGFALFLYDLGQKPPGMRVVRISPSAHYAPGSCAWAASKPRTDYRRPTTYPPVEPPPA